MVDRYSKIISELIKKNYPELKNSKITIKVKEIEKYSMFAKRIGKEEYQIMVNPKKCSGFSDSIIRGKLAHELAHFKRFNKWGSVHFFLDNLLYRFIIYRSWTEKKTDKLAIRKGYAQELILDRKETFKKLSKENPKLLKELEKVYMSSEEIENYAKKLGKI